MSVARV